MPKRIITRFLILSLFFLPVLADFRVSSPDSVITAYIGKTNEIKILLKNEELEKDVIYISVWPTQWVSLDKYWVTLEPKQSQFITLLVTPPEELGEGVHVLTIYTQSLGSNRSSTQTLFLNLKRLEDIFISNLKLDKGSVDPGEVLEMEIVLTNLHKTKKDSAFLDIKILDENGRLVNRLEDAVEMDPRTVKTVKKLYQVDKYQAPGNYFVEVDLKNSMGNTIDRETENFEVKSKHKVERQKSRSYGFFYTEITISVKNEGNEPTDYIVEENLPKITKNFFFPERSPSSEEERDNRIVYKWEVLGLNPGESTVVRYRLRFVNALIGTLLVTLILLTTYEYLTRPGIKKTHLGVLAGGEELKITLKIKNRRPVALKNVVVRDTVPAIAQLVKQFDTREPEIKLTSQGTELTWKIDKINPGEEILLTYKIKPLIDVIGKLTLPKSYFTYKSGPRLVRKITSKAVSVKGKIK